MNSLILQPLYAVHTITVTVHVHVHGPAQLANNCKYQHHYTRYNMVTISILPEDIKSHTADKTVIPILKSGCQPLQPN